MLWWWKIKLYILDEYFWFIVFYAIESYMVVHYTSTQLFFNKKNSQGSVTTRLKCGGIILLQI